MQLNKEKEAATASGSGTLFSDSDDESFSPTMSFQSSDTESVSLVDNDEEVEVKDGTRVEDVNGVTDNLDPFKGPVTDGTMNHVQSNTLMTSPKIKEHSRPY